MVGRSSLTSYSSLTAAEVIHLDEDDKFLKDDIDD